MKIETIILLSITSLCVLQANENENELTRAHALYCKGQYANAIQLYKQAFRQIEQGILKITDPDIEHNAHVNYGQCCWALGDYHTGHQEFDRRLRLTATKQLKNPLTEEILVALKNNGKLKSTKLLARAEYGLGDTFGFMKWLKTLKNAGATIILLSQNPLKGLLSRSTECVDKVVNNKDQDPNFDYDFYLMSTPRFANAFGLDSTKTISGIPNFGAYIHPLEERIVKWKEILQGSKPLGLCWAASSNPVPGGRILKRNIPLKYLAQLATIASTRLYNLQGLPHRPISQDEYEKLKKENQLNGLDEGDILPQEFSMHIFDKDFDQDAFEDTAAVMQVIKLLDGKIVSVDTSTLNLAGALDVPTIGVFADQENIDARWGVVPPGLRGIPSTLFRNIDIYSQEKPGEWQGVINAIKADLEKK